MKNKFTKSKTVKKKATWKSCQNSLMGLSDPKKWSCVSLPNHIAGGPQLSTYEKTILLYLGTLNPVIASEDSIKRATGLTSKVVKRVLKSLRAKGVIVLVSGRGKLKEYAIPSPNNWKLTSSGSSINSSSKTSKKGQKNGKLELPRQVRPSHV